MASKKQLFIDGLKAGIPVILGYIPVGIAYGVMGSQAGMSITETCSLSIFVFAGAAQMMAAGMVGQGATVLSIVITTFILNLRHLIMSTCVMERMQDGSRGQKLLASFGVTDESFAVFTTTEEKNCRIYFFFGLILSTWAAWNLGTLIGAAASNVMPELVSKSLGISLYVMFIALLMPGLRGNGRLALLAGFTAVVNSILVQFMASGWALIIATLLGAFIGVFFVELEDGEKETDT